MSDLMKRQIFITAGAVVIIAVIAGIWFISQNRASETIPERDTYVPGNLLLGTDATSTVGTYLIGFNGMTLYMNANDDAAAPKEWVPYIVPNKDILANVQWNIPGAVGSVLRASGAMQVTYEGHPLYFFSGDDVSGDVNGQGGDWSLVTIPSKQ